MKKNNELKQLKREKTKKSNYGWIIKITLCAFFISLFFSFVSEMVLPNVNILIGVLLVILFIVVGVLFDMIGIAVTSADEKPFHSMSARKVKGADIAVLFKKNADKVSSFCNDVIGDICGIISGSAGVIIAATLASMYSINILIMSLLITALIASITIGGKALGKSIAINKSNIILYEFTKIISIFYRRKK